MISDGERPPKNVSLPIWLTNLNSYNCQYPPPPPKLNYVYVAVEYLLELIIILVFTCIL